MIVTGRLFNVNDGSSIPYVTVQPANADGSSAGNPVVADANGNFYIAFTHAGYLLFTSAGYQPVLLQISADGEVQINMEPKADLPGITISPNVKKGAPWVLLVLLGLILFKK